jgi:hypothetical protein
MSDSAYVPIRGPTAITTSPTHGQTGIPLESIHARTYDQQPR